MTATRARIVGDSPARVFGLTARQRLERQLPRLGAKVVGPEDEADATFSGACVFGASVLKAMLQAAPGAVLRDDRGRVAATRGAGPEEGAAAPAGARSGVEMAGRFDKQLRKMADPLVMRLDDPAPAEQAIFDATYKGVTDFVTKHVWPVPALAAVRVCVRFGLSPNQVTYVSAVLVLAALWLFWTGAFAAGLVVAWVMTFLDTVDGKLARATLTSSKLGDVLDHGIDLIHPPFWWWAWAAGCVASGASAGMDWLALGVILAGYVIQRLQEGLFIGLFKLEMHIWRPFDSFFRKITARRNPNLAILTVAAIFGAPDVGLTAVAVWTGLSLLVHTAQVAQGFVAYRRGPLTSWMAD